MPAPPRPIKSPAPQASPAVVPAQQPIVPAPTQLSRSELATQRQNSAQTPIDLGDIDAPVPSTNTQKVTINPLRSGGASLINVKAMQSELINIGKDIASHSINSAPENKNQKGDALRGADPFSNFLVKQYMNKSEVKGKQFAAIEMGQPSRIETAKENDNLKGVLQTIQQIGTGSGGREQAPDGIWGGRTDNALKQVYALAYALHNMEKDMGLGASIYGDDDLSQFAANIKDDYKSMNDQQKDAKAKILLPNLTKFRSFYDSFRERVLDNKDTQALITQQKSFTSRNSQEQNQAETLDPGVKSIYDQVKSDPIEITLGGKKTTITPANLQSTTNLKTYLKNLLPDQAEAIDRGNGATYQALLAQINSQLGNA